MIRFSEMAAEVSAASDPKRKPTPKAAPAPAPADASGLGCSAYGCPLAGGVSENTRGGGPWFCFEHFQQPATRWAEITTAIRQGMDQQDLLPRAGGRR